MPTLIMKPAMPETLAPLSRKRGKRSEGCEARQTNRCAIFMLNKNKKISI